MLEHPKNLPGHQVIIEEPAGNPFISQIPPWRLRGHVNSRAPGLAPATEIEAERGREQLQVPGAPRLRRTGNTPGTSRDNAATSALPIPTRSPSQGDEFPVPALFLPGRGCPEPSLCRGGPGAELPGGSLPVPGSLSLLSL
ncbi:hypothetical protein DV515_00016236 [Chloebia gouldiae]|uniref:Uncharacterized protein n=1 Tax=Chloebia gouldiae TaxID=44316 RepID=A0A3L8RST1_CHLGU|nr:hypothetical protein DV515_00016236 [Chloebia gouldiae]